MVTASNATSDPDRWRLRVARRVGLELFTRPQPDERDASVSFVVKKKYAEAARDGLVRVTARIAPLDVERFFEFHYTEVRDQSMDMLATWIRTADDQGRSADGLRELALRLGGTH